MFVLKFIRFVPIGLDFFNVKKHPQAVFFLGLSELTKKPQEERGDLISLRLFLGVLQTIRISHLDKSKN